MLTTGAWCDNIIIQAVASAQNCAIHITESDITVLEITVGHRTLSDQILKMSGQFDIMIGHDDRTCHQHILSLLQGVVSQ